MEALRLVLLYVHLIGFALLLGGAIAQYVSGRLRINAAMLWGSVIGLLTGSGSPRRCATATSRRPRSLLPSWCSRC